MKELIKEVNCFNLKYTLECGQCFRWKKQSSENKDEMCYIGVIQDRVIKIRQIGNQVFIKSNKEENLDEVVSSYFDFNQDYQKIENRIQKVDEYVQKSVSNTSGIHHLNQAFFETLMSYIISANNNIPRITKSVFDLSFYYGKKVMFEEQTYYLFPTPEELANVTEEQYRKCGAGFRARYLKNTVKDMIDKKLTEEKIQRLTTEQLQKELLTFQGVGPKVADCIMLFSCQRQEVFPIDVWVERVMTMLYFKERQAKVKKQDILDYAKTHFKNDAGIIQQHLFYNIRENLI